MTENKRFYLDENGINDREYEFSILGEDELVDIINVLNDENKELHKVIEENEKVIQSIYEELTKLRHIKENLRKIRNQWNWLIGSIDYD